MSDDVLQLEQPLNEGGIRSVNFFNGRLLAGRDLSREQAARREADRRVGLAVGDGVAFGLEVERDRELDQPSAPIVRVRAGLAVNRTGQTLRLTADTSVALTRRFDAVAADCVFADCAPASGGVYVAGAGVYLLAIAPSGAQEGSAPTSGLDPGNVRCNTDAYVEAVQFRLLRVDPARYQHLDFGGTRFRNRLAYACFGVEERERALSDPWRVEPVDYGLVDQMRALGLSDHDVPLALVYWTASGLQFVDAWAVRRALLEPDALPAFTAGEARLAPAYLARVRRVVEAQAMCAQFQQHLADLLDAPGDPASFVAAEHFRYLPPFGAVPLARPPLRGFAEGSFFSGLVRRTPGTAQDPQYLDGRVLDALQRQALACAPMDVTRKEFIWVYRPWQNARAAREGLAAQPVAVFASGHLPHAGTARFDLARWDFSNFGLL